MTAGDFAAWRAGPASRYSTEANRATSLKQTRRVRRRINIERWSQRGARDSSQADCGRGWRTRRTWCLPCTKSRKADGSTRHRPVSSTACVFQRTANVGSRPLFESNGSHGGREKTEAFFFTWALCFRENGIREQSIAIISDVRVG